MSIWIINAILVYIVAYGLTSRYRNITMQARKSRDKIRKKFEEENKRLKMQNSILLKEYLELKKELDYANR